MLVKISNPYSSVNNYFSLKNNFDKLVDSFFNDSTKPYISNNKILKSSIVEKDNALHLFVEMPGISKENIKLTLDDDVITISAERKPDTLDVNSRWIRSERAYGKFSRSFQLPDKVKTENINAEYKDGILKVLLPKAEKIEPKEIEIKIK